MSRIYLAHELLLALKKVIPNLPDKEVVEVALRLAANEIPTVTVKQYAVLDPNGYPATMETETVEFAAVKREEFNAMWVLLEETTSTLAFSVPRRQDLIQRARNCLARNRPV